MQNPAQSNPCFPHLGKEGRHSHLSKLEKNGAFSFSPPSRKIDLKSLSSQGAFSFCPFLPVLLYGLPQHLFSFSTGELSLALIKRQLKGRLMQGKAACLIGKESREGICQTSPGCDVCWQQLFLPVGLSQCGGSSFLFYATTISSKSQGTFFELN